MAHQAEQQGIKACFHQQLVCVGFPFGSSWDRWVIKGYFGLPGARPSNGLGSSSAAVLLTFSSQLIDMAV